ncbi:MAG TPA: nuclear transport factor 2 family protein [Solirubrobacteraceae bacterium]
MGQEDHLRTVGEFTAAIDAHDRAAAYACLAPGLEWHALGLVVAADQPVYQGREAVWTYIESLYETYSALSIEVARADVVGNAVVARVELRGEPVGSAGGVEAQWSSVLSFRDGLIARVDNYEDHDEAVTDAELRLGMTS